MWYSTPHYVCLVNIYGKVGAGKEVDEGKGGGENGWNSVKIELP